ncbi:alpha-amylase family glycosyl hydrolase [Mycoplasma marinum]|uniref:Alpha-amylase n=1 Tax=Mycoplasma marinum TaxID=1937190 RepID=A0A4R0XKM8_9MOLU|nr:alpha-amylase family glycosyl hydrolase [Mycoplasma marinum]TCG11193.1 sucrase-isomaltase [Mycoplasma marinum]
MKTIKWKDKVIYQIFPRSFKDANNDGDGDIKGITSKMEYLSNLGIDAIWLCPTYETNFADAGYDVKDYKAVWKQFGTLEDFKEMTQEAKKHGIDIIMDIVLNHVSDEHPWFKKACESVENIEHNYFIWRDKLSKDEEKAMSIFGGSAWEFVPSVNKYYFHLFAKEQVDLNWEHPDTIEAMADIIDFWYSNGVKGFRLDAIKHISKVFPEGNENDFSWGPTAVPQLQKFNEIAFKDKDDAFILGESSGITLEEAIKYGTGKDKVSTNYYNFSWWWLGWGETGRNGYDPEWNYKKFVEEIKPFQESELVNPELMTNFLSNHDTSRAISRWGNEGVFWEESAKSLAMMLFVMKGIPCIYYGEEIGMLNPRFKNRSEFKDVDALNAYRDLVEKQGYYTEEEMTKYLSINGRDNCRTPMAWNDKENAGFNDGAKPWIKVGYGYRDINVESQINDEKSIFNFYKKIISIRKSEKFRDILIDGTSKVELLPSGAFKVVRTSKKTNKKIVTLINIRDRKLKLESIKGKRIISSWNDKKPFKGQLRPYESIMFEI